jgi:predicted RNase H-like HicB family nuclease
VYAAKERNMRYAIIIEGVGDDFSAYAPDVPGCGVAGDSVEEVTALLRDALALHLADLTATGQPLPMPSIVVATVDVDAEPIGA